MASVKRFLPYMLFFFGLFGWIVVLPLYGEVGFAWAASQGIDFSPMPLWFLAGHAPGLIASGYLLDYRPTFAVRGARVSILVAALTTFGFWQLESSTWPALAAVSGFFTPLGIVAWSRWYATLGRGSLGRAFALPAAGMSLLGWLFAGGIGRAPDQWLLLATLLPLVIAFVASFALTALPEAPAGPATTVQQPREPALSFGLFILFIYVVAGMSYRYLIVTPINPQVHETLRRFPYVVGALGAGFLADRQSLHPITRVGAALLALAFLIGAWGQAATVQGLSVALNGLAFGFLEPVTWLLLASLAKPHTAGRWFGWGLNLNVVALLAGATVTLPAGSLSSERLGLLAASAILGAILLLQAARDPLAPEPEPPANEGLPEGLATGPLALTLSGQLSVADLLTVEFGEILSKRELEVGRLALAGRSTREIATELYLSENTVKTHLRNLYRKTQTANRADLYRRLVEPDEGAPSSFGR